MTEREKGVSFRRRHRLDLQGVALIMVLGAPIALYGAAQAGNRPLLWGLVATMGMGMALAVWAG